MPSAPVPELTCWALSEGFAGMENQCRGLAEAIGVDCEIKQVGRPGLPWTLLPPTLWPKPLERGSGGNPLSPPWPDLLISSGRGSVAAALAIRKASKGKTFTVHIQTPYVAQDKFDMVIIPEHDGLRGANVVVAKTALHRVSRKRLDTAASHPDPRFSGLPRPLISVLVGGSNKRRTMSGEMVADFADKLLHMAEQSGGGLAVTPSRRTGEDNIHILKQKLKIIPSFIWDGSGENPYFHMLAQADALVVTGDSVSMISEACATGKPVYVWNPEPPTPKMQAFQDSIAATGATRPFDGTLKTWTYPTLDETQRVADMIREKMGARKGF